MKVIDLYSGAGGFTEGFRQAGFDVIWAVDNWGPAVRTYRINHPKTEVVKEDIMELDLDEIPEADIIIGSPPCGDFSYAKNGGNGDIQEGLKLVYRFLEIVEKINPDYWIMENVPRLADYLEDEMSFKRFSDDSKIVIDLERIEVLNSADFGTPQRRKRAFSGDFPLPDVVPDRAENLERFSRTDEDLGEITLGEVVSCFPSPNANPESVGEVKDPNYDVTVDGENLTDHYYNTHLTKREAVEIRKKKIDHSYYGSMKFPDNLEQPSRTVIAMNRRVSREIIVIEDESRPNYSGYRMLSLRELAALQSFPITYQFDGGTFSKKRRLIGNAVPPTMSYALARSIAKKENLDVEREISPTEEEPQMDMKEKDWSARGNRKLTIKRKFRHHVPYDDMREFRVDLENEKDRSPKHPLDEHHEDELNHPVGFKTVFYKGYASEVESKEIEFEEAMELLETINDHHSEKIAGFIDSLIGLGKEVPDATTFQAMRSRRKDADTTIEYDLLEKLGNLVDDHFPQELHDMDDTIEIKWMGGTDLPIRTGVKIIGSAYLAEKLENCSCFVAENPDEVYLPEGADKVDQSKIVCEECVDEVLHGMITNLDADRVEEVRT